jgi:hypothetical protein
MKRGDAQTLISPLSAPDALRQLALNDEAILGVVIIEWNRL